MRRTRLAPSVLAFTVVVGTLLTGCSAAGMADPRTSSPSTPPASPTGSASSIPNPAEVVGLSLRGGSIGFLNSAGDPVRVVRTFGTDAEVTSAVGRLTSAIGTEPSVRTQDGGAAEYTWDGLIIQVSDAGDASQMVLDVRAAHVGSLTVTARGIGVGDPESQIDELTDPDVAPASGTATRLLGSESREVDGETLAWTLTAEVADGRVVALGAGVPMDTID